MRTLHRVFGRGVVGNDIEHALRPMHVITKGIRLAPRRREPSVAFEWPLRTLHGLEPRVTAAHPGERLVDLGYIGLGDLDRRVPILAANDGVVACALEDDNGCAVSIDHEGTWSTHYTGLSELAVIRCLPKLKRRQHVRAGQVIGYAARSRIGFELWRWTDERGFVPVDASAHLATWTRTADAAKEAA